MCKMNTPTTAVYGEFGHCSVYMSRYIRILKYWFRLILTDTIIMETVYKISYEDWLKGKKTCLSNFKSYCMTMDLIMFLTIKQLYMKLYV
mgnify:CR=1 FL=1